MVSNLCGFGASRNTETGHGTRQQSTASFVSTSQRSSSILTTSEHGYNDDVTSSHYESRTHGVDKRAQAGRSTRLYSHRSDSHSHSHSHSQSQSQYRSSSFTTTNSPSDSSSDLGSSSSNSRGMDDESTSTTASSSEFMMNTEEILNRHQAALSSRPCRAPNAALTYEPRKTFSPCITLGPLIGMVTENSARVLIETSADVRVKCFATDAMGVQHGVSLACLAKRPQVAVFEELRPNTYYKLSFDCPVPGIIRTGFTTLAKNSKLPNNNSTRTSGTDINYGPSPTHKSGSGSGADGSFDAEMGVAAVSFYGNSNEIEHKGDLWKQLHRDVLHKRVNYILHLGSSVITSGVVDSLFEVEQELSEESICEELRQAYREAFTTNPCVRMTLANCPSLFGIGCGEVMSENVRSPLARRIQKCCYRVYNEYCRSLFEDVAVFQSSPLNHQQGDMNVVAEGGVMEISQGYHFHAFGKFGFLFIDTLAAALFHRSREADAELPLLGDRQWRHLDYALSDTGYFSKCSTLFVCTHAPLAQISSKTFAKALPVVQAQMSVFNDPSFSSETSELLALLLAWKNTQSTSRQVCILSGTACDAGLTTLRASDDLYASISSSKEVGPGARGPANEEFLSKKEEAAARSLLQVTAGPIASVAGERQPHASLSKGKSVCACCPPHVSADKTFAFTHNKIVKANNYALISVGGGANTGLKVSFRTSPKGKTIVITDVLVGQ